MLDYREIAAELERMALPDSAEPIHILWTVGARLAVGRDHGGGHLVVIPGPELPARRELVRGALEHGFWRTGEGQNIQGSLLRLPEQREFTMATSTIASELERQGIADRPVEEVFC